MKPSGGGGKGHRLAKVGQKKNGRLARPREFDSRLV